MAGNLDELPSWAGELLATEPVGHLALIDDDGRPRALPVAFAVVDGSIWSAVDDKPKRVPGAELARVRWLRARPQSAFTVDRYADDWSRLAWVQAIGETAVVEVAGRERVLEALSERYPAYRERAPRGPLLELRPARAICWRAEG
ncbi:MAG: pyridoxamine 5'-phosphate oxidase family protein [Solirubrobacterales bacterium]